MDVIVKSFTGIIMIVLVASVSLGLINSAILEKNADAYLTYTINRIENSDYSAAVINECTINAEENGYELIVNLYGIGEKYGNAQLKYNNSIGLLGINRNKQIMGAIT